MASMKGNKTKAGPMDQVDTKEETVGRPPTDLVDMEHVVRMVTMCAADVL